MKLDCGFDHFFINDRTNEEQLFDIVYDFFNKDISEDSFRVATLLFGGSDTERTELFKKLVVCLPFDISYCSKNCKISLGKKTLNINLSDRYRKEMYKGLQGNLIIFYSNDNLDLEMLKYVSYRSRFKSKDKEGNVILPKLYIFV